MFPMRPEHSFSIYGRSNGIMGAAFAAGISAGIYDSSSVYDAIKYKVYSPRISEELRRENYSGWQNAIHQVLAHN